LTATALNEGSLNLSTSVHNFLYQAVGTSSSVYGTVLKNSYAFPISLAFTMTGNTADFVTTAYNCPAMLAPNASCNLQFEFKPLVGGTLTETVEITGTYNGSPVAVTSLGATVPGVVLTGTAVNEGRLNLTTSVHNFDDQAVGTSSIIYGTVLTNSYAFPVSLTFATTGNTADFLTTANNCPATLPANASCNLQFAFTPKVTGFLTETMGITATHTGGPIAVTSLGATVPGVILRGTGQ
jgi:hypothetical protein